LKEKSQSKKQLRTLHDIDEPVVDDVICASNIVKSDVLRAAAREWIKELEKEMDVHSRHFKDNDNWISGDKEDNDSRACEHWVVVDDGFYSFCACYLKNRYLIKNIRMFFNLEDR